MLPPTLVLAGLYQKWATFAAGRLARQGRAQPAALPSPTLDARLHPGGEKVWRLGPGSILGLLRDDDRTPDRRGGGVINRALV